MTNGAALVLFVCCCLFVFLFIFIFFVVASLCHSLSICPEYKTFQSGYFNKMIIVVRYRFSYDKISDQDRK